MEIDFQILINFINKMLFNYIAPNDIYHIVILKKFLWLPRIFNYKLKWLKYANIYYVPKKVYSIHYGPLLIWEPFEWAD